MMYAIVAVVGGLIGLFLYCLFSINHLAEQPASGAQGRRPVHRANDPVRGVQAH